MPIVLALSLLAGYATLGALCLHLLAPRRNRSSVETFYLGYPLAIAAVHTLLLLGFPLFPLAQFLCALGAIAILRKGTRFLLREGLKRKRVPFLPFKVPLEYRHVILIVLALFPAGMILFESLRGWDARSIWYLQAKMLFIDGRLVLSSFANPALFAFAHPDYPKANSFIAGQIASLVGYWNFYWPKLSLWFWLAHSFAGLHGLPFGNGVLGVCTFLLMGLGQHYLWNGYMDAYLSFYVFLAITYLAIGVQRLDGNWILRALPALVLLPQMKFEGLVLSVVAMASFAWIARGELRKLVDKHLLGYLALGMAPVFIWEAVKRLGGISNDMVAHFDMGRVWARVSNPEVVGAVLKGLLVDTYLKWVLLGYVVVACLGGWLLRRESGSASRFSTSVPILLSFIAYMAFLFFTFICTYLDLAEHMRTAVSRLEMSLTAMLIGSLVILLQPARVCLSRLSSASR